MATFEERMTVVNKRFKELEDFKLLVERHLNYLDELVSAMAAKINDLENITRETVRMLNYCGSTEKLCNAERKGEEKLVSEYDNMDARR